MRTAEWQTPNAYARGLPRDKQRSENRNQRADVRFGGLTMLGKDGILSPVSAQEIIEQIKALPANERAQVAKFVVENDDSWIPESFKEGMADAEPGRLVDLDTALNEPYSGE
jgi:hypothetical protein